MRLIFFITIFLLAATAQSQVNLTSLKKSPTKFKFGITKLTIPGQTGYFQEYGTLPELMDSLGMQLGTVIDSMRYNPATDTLSLYTSEGVFKTLIPGSSGITTLNGLTNATQTFEISTASSGFGITSAGSTHTFNLPFEENVTSFRLGHLSLRRENSVSMGYNAMGSSGATATNNIAIGNGVLRLAGSTGSGGTNNTGIGFQTLYGLTTGYNNMGFGSYAGGNLSTGYNNICIGAISGLTLTTQNSNTFIGYEAGRFNTGSGSIFIGNQAGRSETASNKLYIENSDSSQPLIGGDFGSNLVGINVNGTPTNTLDINGEIRIRDLVTTNPTQMLGADANGVTSGITLGTGLSFTGTTLNSTGITGSGTATRVAFWNSASDLTSDANLYWDNTNDRLGVGTTTPTQNLHIVGNARIEGSSGIPSAVMGRNSSGVISNLALGSGLSISSGFLNYTETGLGTVTQVNTTNGITGGPITTTGTVQLTGLASSFHNLTGNGFAVKTGTSTTAIRTLAAGVGISITNADGVSGNPTITATGGLPAGATSQTLAYLSGAWTASNFLKCNSSTTTTGNSKRVTINDDIGGEVWSGFYHTSTKFLVNGKVQMNSTSSTSPTTIMGRNTDFEVGTINPGSNMELTSGTLSKKQIVGGLHRTTTSSLFNTNATPAKLPFNAVYLDVNTTSSTVNSEIKTNVSNAGAYKATCECTFNPGGTTTYSFGIYKNGSLLGTMTTSLNATTGTAFIINTSAYTTSLTTTDTIDVRVSTPTTGTSNNTTAKCQLILTNL